MGCYSNLHKGVITWPAIWDNMRRLIADISVNGDKWEKWYGYEQEIINQGIIGICNKNVSGNEPLSKLVAYDHEWLETAKI